MAKRTAKSDGWHDIGDRRVHYKNGKYHNDSGPAIEHANGDKSWWVNGKLHRLDGPAVEWADGTTQWWVDGELHRLDGPAVESRSGYCEWWVDDQEIDIKSIFDYEPSVPLTEDEQLILRLKV